MPHDEAKAAEVCLLLTLWVRAMVTDKDAVFVKPLRSSGKSLVLQLQLACHDRGKVIGRGGRTALSLRILLQAVAKEIGENYQLEILDSKPLDAPPR